MIAAKSGRRSRKAQAFRMIVRLNSGAASIPPSPSNLSAQNHLRSPCPTPPRLVQHSSLATSTLPLPLLLLQSRRRNRLARQHLSPVLLDPHLLERNTKVKMRANRKAATAKYPRRLLQQQLHLQKMAGCQTPCGTKRPSTCKRSCARQSCNNR